MTAVEVNGSPWTAPPGVTLSRVVAEWCDSCRGIAVALNGEVVPRARWEATLLAAGDRVEIVTAAAGG